MRKTYPPGWLGEVETEIRRQMLELERDRAKEIMEAHDVDAAAVELAGKVHRRVLRAEQTSQTSQTSMTAAGPVLVARWLYRDREAYATNPFHHPGAPPPRGGVCARRWETQSAS